MKNKWTIAMIAVTSMFCLGGTMVLATENSLAENNVTGSAQTNVTLADANANFSMINGAYLRLSSDGQNGLRFMAAMKTEFYTANQTAITEMGILIGPVSLNTDYVLDWNDLTLAEGATTPNAVKVTYDLSLEEDKAYIYDETIGETEYKTFAGSLTKLAQNTYDKEFIGLGYYVMGGEVHYATTNGKNHVRSLSNVAKAVMNDTIFEDYSNTDKTVIASFSDKNQIANGSFTYGDAGWTVDWAVNEGDVADGLGYVVSKNNVYNDALAEDYGTKSDYVYSYVNTDEEGGINNVAAGGTLRSKTPFVVKENSWLTLNWGSGVSYGIWLQLVDKDGKVWDEYDNHMDNSVDYKGKTLSRAIDLSHLSGKTLYVQFNDKSREDGIIFSDLVTNASACPEEATQLVSRYQPTLTLSSTSNILATVGNAVELPTATAEDFLGNDLTSKITVSYTGAYKGTATNKNGPITITPNAAGKIVATYRVEAENGLCDSKSIIIDVGSATNGNVLTNVLLSEGNGVVYDAGELICEQKVSMIVNIESWNSLVMFNIRGDVEGSPQWAGGMVLRIDKGQNDISISAKGHDTCIFGATTWDKIPYLEGEDFLLEYQVQSVFVDEEEYVKVRLWLQGEEMQWLVKEGETLNNGGEINVEDGEKAIYRKVSRFEEDGITDNLSATNFHVATNTNDVVKIKELRLDGTSCALPDGPTVLRFEMPTFDTDASNDGFNTNLTTGTITENLWTVGGDSNEDYVYLKIRPSRNEGALILNVTGATAQETMWQGGLILRITGTAFEVRTRHINDSTALIATYDSFNLTNMPIDSNNSTTLVYKLTYHTLETNGKTYVKGIQLDVWVGETGSALTKLVPTIMDSVNVSYDGATDTFIIRESAFSDVSQMTPGKITFAQLKELNGGTDESPEYTSWWISAGKYATTAPLTANSTTIIQQSAAFTATEDTYVKTANDVNESYMRVVVNHNADATAGTLGINMLGSVSNYGWNGGLILRANINQNATLRWGDINKTQLATLDLNTLGSGENYAIVYKLTYIFEEGVITKLRLDMWSGVSGGTLNKIGIVGNVDHSCISYDENEKAFYLDYRTIGYLNYAPDCTVTAVASLNNKSGNCTFNLANVYAQTTLYTTA